jgi:hypothetical protein
MLIFAAVAVVCVVAGELTEMPWRRRVADAGRSRIDVLRSPPRVDRHRKSLLVANSTLEQEFGGRLRGTPANDSCANDGWRQKTVRAVEKRLSGRPQVENRLPPEV